MCQIVRNLTLADAEGCPVLICDRDAKWRRAVRVRLEDAGIRPPDTVSGAMPTLTPNGSSARSWRNV